MLDDETNILAHHKSQMGNNAIPIFQQAVNENPELFIEAQTQIAAATYATRETKVQFDTWHWNISYFASGQGKWNSDMESCTITPVLKE